jgi:hypothetical protein
MQSIAARNKNSKLDFALVLYLLQRLDAPQLPRTSGAQGSSPSGKGTLPSLFKSASASVQNAAEVLHSNANTVPPALVFKGLLLLCIQLDSK